MKFLRATVSLLFCLAVLGLAVSAQTSTGGVNGTITDPNGAAVPGSTVRLVNQATNIEARAATSESGGSLPIVCGHERILKLFTITGLDGVFSIHKTVDEALAGLQA